MPGAIYLKIEIDTKKLEALYHSAEGLDDSICDIAVEHVHTEAAKRAPVLSGYLRDHITKISQGGVFRVLSEAPYSLFVEYGTRKMRAQPFLRPALESVKWPVVLREAFRRAGW